MNSESDTPDEPLKDLALRYAAGDMAEAERVAFETCLACPHSRATPYVAEFKEIIASLTASTLPPCDAPPPQVRERILAAIEPAPPSPSVPLPVYRLGADQVWDETIHPGVRTSVLSSASPEFTVMLVDMAPGSAFPPHEHHGVEDVYLLSGDALIEGRLLGAGDFMHSGKGTHHKLMTSPSGCRALLITSRDNYSPHLGRAYGMARRMVTRFKRALGAGTAD